MNTSRSIAWFMALGVALGPGALGAQEALLDGRMEHGGFGGPVLKLTQVADEFGVLMGGRGGWIINSSLVIGGGGYGLANRGSFERIVAAPGRRGRLEMGYGGLELAWVHRSDELVHFTIGTLLGAGGVNWDPEGQSGSQHNDWFFVAEPELDVVLNVTTVFRVGLGVSYRYAGSMELLDLREGDFSGAAGVVVLKFGRF